MYKKNQPKTRYVLVDVLIVLGIAAAVLFCLLPAGRKNGVFPASEDMAQTVQASAAVEPSEPFTEGFLNISAVLPLAVQETATQSRLYLRGSVCTLFLPACFSDNSVTLSFDEKTASVLWNGEKISPMQEVSLPGEGETCTLHLQDSALDVDTDCTLQVMRSENLPAIFVDTANGTMDWIIRDPSNSEPGSYACVLADGTLDSMARIREIHLHGNTTLYPQKKSYRINLEDPSDLLSMGNGSSFVLISNSLDPLQTRNAVSLDLARSLGIPYVSDAEYADVFLNGAYGGCYLVMEPVEIGEGRVDIPEEGSFLVCEDWPDEDRVRITAENTEWNIRYPSDPSEEEQSQITAELTAFQDAVRAAATAEDCSSLASTADVPSLARMYLMDFLSNNSDCNQYSTYYYYSAADGKIHAGPVWDFDRTFGNNDTPPGNFPYCNAYQNGFPEELFSNPEFLQEINALAESHDFQEELMDDFKETAEEIRSSREMDLYLYGHTGAADYGNDADNEARLQDSIEERTSLLDAVLHDRDSLCRVQIHIGDETAPTRDLWIPKGEEIPEECLDYWLEQTGEGHWCILGGSNVWRHMKVLHDCELYQVEKSDESESADAYSGGAG